MVWVQHTKYFILYCLGLIWLYTQTVSSAEVNLLTTEGATTDLNWKVENWNYPPDQNGWEDTSMPYEDETLRGYQVCQIDLISKGDEKPETWLLLPQINISGVSRVFIEVNFTMLECTDMNQTCRETVSIYYRTTSHNNDNMKFHPKIFKKIDTVAAETRFSTSSWNSIVNHEKVDIPFINVTSELYLHIAIVDAGACVALMGVRVYQKVCVETVASFAIFEETKTGASDTSLVPVLGTCVANSIYTDSVLPTIVRMTSPSSIRSAGPLYHCTSSGDWQVPTGFCECSAGFEPDEDSLRCSPCSEGAYKDSLGNEACTPCPSNSNSSNPGATSCRCNEGYTRIPKQNDNEDKNRYEEEECKMCSTLPSKPQNIKGTFKDTNSSGTFMLAWRKPADDGGCNVIMYHILCHYSPTLDHADSSESGVSDCSHVEYEPSCYGISGLEVTVRNFRGHSMYNFTVLAYTLSTKSVVSTKLRKMLFEDIGKTGFSNSTQMKAWWKNEELTNILIKSSSSISHQTSDMPPSEPRDIEISTENQTSLVITWKKPKYPNGKNLFYTVHYVLENGPHIRPVPYTKANHAWQQIRTNSTDAILSGLHPGSVYKVIVNVYNSAGSNNGSEALFGKTLDEEPIDNPNDQKNFPYIIATIVIAILVVLICIALFLQWKCRSKSNTKAKCNGNAETPTPFRPYNSRHDSLDQRTYVDPFCLDSMPSHRFLCEISPESITIEDVIGCGEFGEVYKGTLATIDIKTGQETTIDVAVKRLKNQCKPEEQKSFFQEAMSLEKFRHPNVVHLEAVVTQTRPFIIVTELMSNGCLHSFLSKLKSKALQEQTGNNWKLPLSHETIVTMLCGVASGMEYLSGRGYVHRDLAARNVLVNSDKVCKVADFGLLRELDKKDSENGNDGNGTYTTSGGKIAIKWAAPEAISYRTYTQYSDVWSYGILMWEAASYGEKPYWNYSNDDVIAALDEGMRLPAPDRCPSLLHQLMLKCWQRDHLLRPTFTEIISKLTWMLNETGVLDIPASPASCGEQEMFFGDEDIVDGVDHEIIPSHLKANGQLSEEFLRTVHIDTSELSPDEEEESDDDDVTLCSFNQDGEGSEISSCASTICASEITVCPGNGEALYVPLLRSESVNEDNQTSHPGTPMRNYYSLTR